MILSHKQIEEIAAAVTKNFNEFFFGKDEEIRLPRATPIAEFAKDYLGLNVSFTRLSSDGSICGLTSYADTVYIIEENSVYRTIPLKRNQVLLDVSLIKPGQEQQLRGKRRFALAHECAHQILFQMESQELKNKYQQLYSSHKAYSLRELKTREDWSEWQANVLGAALLMPQREIDLAIEYFATNRKLVNYEGHLVYPDKVSLDIICHQFGVSKAAALIRLEQLGYIENRSYNEYEDEMEVWS